MLVFSFNPISTSLPIDCECDVCLDYESAQEFYQVYVVGQAKAAGAYCIMIIYYLILVNLIIRLACSWEGIHFGGIFSSLLSSSSE